MARPQPLTLREPAALKALAHPVRQDLIALLDDNTVVTATAASERVGMSPSAVSHHLRLLEKYGIVERVEGSEDARERPWRLRPGGLNLSPAAGDRSGQAAVMVLVRRQVDRQLERMERLLRADEDGEVEEADEGTLGFAFTRARLTRDEARELVHRIEAILDELRARRAEPSRSEDALEYSLAASVLPTDPEEFVRTVQRERSSPR